MRIDELIGSLQKFDMNLDKSKNNKGKSEKNITLQVAAPTATKNRKFDANANLGKFKGKGDVINDKA
ncbi:hypothetical protein Gohar_018876 [Gossypium harknessii]|uniref:Uncharacterized protein n=1 Tax=Gossypium harknessii TaxID=34285 RepID=A0A7J9GAQ7_9ROSI|nr:hypothetical protein [Gossypium harknessii]